MHGGVELKWNFAADGGACHIPYLPIDMGETGDEAVPVLRRPPGFHPHRFYFAAKQRRHHFIHNGWGYIYCYPRHFLLQTFTGTKANQVSYRRDLPHLRPLQTRGLALCDFVEPFSLEGQGEQERFMGRHNYLLSHNLMTLIYRLFERFS